MVGWTSRPQIEVVDFAQPIDEIVSAASESRDDLQSVDVPGRDFQFGSTALVVPPFGVVARTQNSAGWSQLLTSVSMS